MIAINGALDNRPSGTARGHLYTGASSVLAREREVLRCAKKVAAASPDPLNFGLGPFVAEGFISAMDGA